MKTNSLFYKILKETVSTEDYINWAHDLLENDLSSPSINIISSFSNVENVFQVEVYFERALNELGIEKPAFEICARSYINHLAKKIIEENEHSIIFDLAYMIYRIVSLDLHYPDDLMEWYEVSELIDEIQHGDKPKEFNVAGVVIRIKKEAKIHLELNEKWFFD